MTLSTTYSQTWLVLIFLHFQHIHVLLSTHAVSSWQNEVLATPGWERAVALINNGKIPDGAVILTRSFRSRGRWRPEACLV